VCRKTSILLPCYLLPYKRYLAAEIEGVLRHLFDGGKLSESPSGADESTLRRWRKEFSHKMQEWAGLLEARVLRLIDRAPHIIQLSVHPLKRLEQALSYLPALPLSWTVILQTIWWLKNSHPL
jgi:hypothetical protein